MMMEKKYLDVANALIKSIQNMGENFTDNKFVKMSVTFEEDDSNDELTEVTLSFEDDGMKISVDKLYDEDEFEDECYCGCCDEEDETNDPTEWKFDANVGLPPEFAQFLERMTQERITKFHNENKHLIQTLLKRQEETDDGVKEENVMQCNSNAYKIYLFGQQDETGKYTNEKLIEMTKHLPQFVKHREKMAETANKIKEEIKHKSYHMSNDGVRLITTINGRTPEQIVKNPFNLAFLENNNSFNDFTELWKLSKKPKVEETNNYVDTKRKNFYHTSIGKIFYMDHAWQSDGKQLVDDILHMVKEERLGKGMSQTVLVIAKDRYQMNSIADNFANNVEETKNIVIDNKSAYIHIGNIMIQVKYLDEKNILDDIYGLPMFNLLINLTGDESLNKYINSKKE